MENQTQVAVPRDRAAYVLGWVSGEAETAANEIQIAAKHLDAAQFRARALEIAERLRGAEERGERAFDAAQERAKGGAACAG